MSVARSSVAAGQRDCQPFEDTVYVCIILSHFVLFLFDIRVALSAEQEICVDGKHKSMTYSSDLFGGLFLRNKESLHVIG